MTTLHHKQLYTVHKLMIEYMAHVLQIVAMKIIITS